jgi:predicted DNA-binding transcriptional regulator AlpA
MCIGKGGKNARPFEHQKTYFILHVWPENQANLGHSATFMELEKETKGQRQWQNRVLTSCMVVYEWSGPSNNGAERIAMTNARRNCLADEKLLTTTQAAEVLGLSRACLDSWRSNRPRNLPFIRAGRRAVRYRLPDLLAWIESKKQTPSA